MTNLDCKVKSCYYNKEQKCCLEGIKVKGMEATKPDSTACGSFRDKNEGRFTNSCGCDANPMEKSDIHCEAYKCCYNDRKKCTASGIHIEGGNASTYKETCCGTFKVQ